MDTDKVLAAFSKWWEINSDFGVPRDKALVIFCSGAAAQPVAPVAVEGCPICRSHDYAKRRPDWNVCPYCATKINHDSKPTTSGGKGG